ncbi:MAG: anti-sigma factor RsbA family regulatory protein [Solirubrobacteraceae bacterium]
MATTAEHVERRPTDGFRHEALLYAGDDGFLEGTLPWIRDAVAAGEPILVVVSAARIARLREELGAEAAGVSFADMADVGTNPGRIIPAWHAFVDANAGSGRRLRGIGEPIWAERSPDELVECQRHEALLNLAFAGAEDFWLLCPYDVDALDPDVIAKAHGSHPTVVGGDESRRSDTYEDLGAVAAPFAAPFSEPPPGADVLPFASRTLAAVRRLVELRARDAGLSEAGTSDLVLAVNEVATNSVRHGGGEGVLRAWLTDEMLIFEVADAGAIADPLAGRVRPASGQSGGHGLWLCNQACDLVQLRSFAGGSVVRLHKRRGA